jgi:hypothetical protein
MARRYHGWEARRSVGRGLRHRPGRALRKIVRPGSDRREQRTSDFVLRLQIKLDPGGNNGVGIRTKTSKELVC